MPDATALSESLETVDSLADAEMSERDVENLFLENGCYEALGYEGTGVDIRSEFTLSDESICCVDCLCWSLVSVLEVATRGRYRQDQLGLGGRAQGVRRGSVQIRLWRICVGLESPRHARLPRLAARFGRFAACSACVAGVRRERLALSVRQDSDDSPSKIEWFPDAYLNTTLRSAGNRSLRSRMHRNDSYPPTAFSTISISSSVSPYSSYTISSISASVRSVFVSSSSARAFVLV